MQHLNRKCQFGVHSFFLDFTLKKDLTKEWMAEMTSDPATMVATNACWKNDIIEICTRRNVVGQTQHVYSNKVGIRIGAVSVLSA